jgi:hypothetical protein
MFLKSNFGLTYSLNLNLTLDHNFGRYAQLWTSRNLGFAFYSESMASMAEFDDTIF